MGAEADADIINKKVLTHNAIHTHEKDPNYISRVQFFLKKSGVKAEPSVITFVLSDCLSGLKFKKSVEDANKAVKDGLLARRSGWFIKGYRYGIFGPL